MEESSRCGIENVGLVDANDLEYPKPKRCSTVDSQFLDVGENDGLN
jgi:hypothetical protein